MATTAEPHSQRRLLGEGRSDLAGIANKLAELAEQLQRAARNDGSTDDGFISDQQGELRRASNKASLLAAARHAYWLRRQRAQIFGSAELFGEPAWDILLDLYIAHAEGKAVSVSSACIGSASPATTGLRWLSVLVDHRLIAREADANDQRRIMVRLTPSGVEAMERFLEVARS